MTTRHEARRLALEILYQADVTASDAPTVVSGWAEADRELPPFTQELVGGVWERIGEIDPVLDEHALGWSVSRMAAVDRTILRIAVYELLHAPDVPPAVAISEAVEAAVELSSEDSAGFVNGILGRIARGMTDGERATAG